VPFLVGILISWFNFLSILFVNVFSTFLGILLCDGSWPKLMKNNSLHRRYCSAYKALLIFPKVTI
jgi:hypothetical protein